jgi:hypothetical protein
VQKVRLAEACARAGLPMDGIAAAIRAGGCRWRSWRRPRALRGPVLASGADQLAASAGRGRVGLAPGVTFVDVGELALKGIAHLVRLLEAAPEAASRPGRLHHRGLGSRRRRAETGRRDSMDETTVGIAALERTPLFAGLDRRDLENVVGCAERVSFEAGRAIVERLDPGDAMYVIVSGAAEVDVGGRFHRLQRGDFFGEMAVLAGRPREATVKAVERVEALRIPADGFQAFLLENPKIAVAMLRSLVERLREVQDRLDTWIGGVW